jgi:inosine-uridine nucleoside N-ribohydrolase
MRVWIDTDVALGAPRGDVDDGFALAALLRAATVEILGISTVFGNTRSDLAADAARAIVELSGQKVEVIEGASAPGRITRAAEAIARLPPDTVLLALGPLTNLVHAPEHVELRAVGGNLSSWGRWPPLWPFEFNLAKDAEAAQHLFASGIRRRLYPLDACCSLAVGISQLRQFAASADPLARHLARGSWRWLAYSPLRYRALSFPAWDLVPALDVCGLLPARFDLRRLRLEGRGLLVPDARAAEAYCLRELDPTQAWQNFTTLFAA